MTTTTKAFIQYKGTDICLDLRCDCGNTSHYDGYSAYAIRCPHCGRTFDMPQTVQLTAASDHWEPVEAVKDGE